MLNRTRCRLVPFFLILLCLQADKLHGANIGSGGGEGPKGLDICAYALVAPLALGGVLALLGQTSFREEWQGAEGFVLSLWRLVRTGPEIRGSLADPYGHYRWPLRYRSWERPWW